MTENVENLLLEHMKKSQYELADIKSILKEHTHRFGRIETALARVGSQLH